jgi:glycosyltransferase involved in cell wall biosynthesis
MSGLQVSFLLSSLWLSGGVRDVVEYTNRLSARGHHLTLVIPGGTGDADMAAELGPAVRVVESAVRRLPQMTRAHQLRLVWSMADAVPQSDVVISTHTPTTAPTFIATRLQRKGRPVWFYQDYLQMFQGRPMEQWLLRNALRWHDVALTISEPMSEELRRYAPGDVRTARIGLSHAQIFRAVLPEARAQNCPRRILYLGDMRPRKGLYDLLAAAQMVQAQVPEIKLVIVSKEECSIETALPFEYHYRPSREQLAALYTTSDLFVSSSWWESFGIPPLEAMACATPVVMTDSMGGMDYARHEENCLVVPPQQPPALAAAILRVLQDRELAHRLAENGPPTAARYDWEQVTDGFERVLYEVVQR